MSELIVVVNIAQWQKLKAMVLDSVSSPITKRVYNMALEEFLAWFQQEPRPGFTKATVSAWRVSLEDRKLGSPSIIIRMSAIHGGWNQPQAHAQFVSNIVDFGMNIQGALEAARFTKGNFDGCDLSMETRIAPDVIKQLQSMGRVIHPVGQYSGRMGGGQAVMSTQGGVHFGASDPRKDGAAVPENPDFKNR